MKAPHPTAPLARASRAGLRWLTFPAALSIFTLAAAALQQRWLPRPEL